MFSIQWGMEWYTCMHDCSWLNGQGLECVGVKLMTMCFQDWINVWLMALQRGQIKDWPHWIWGVFICWSCQRKWQWLVEAPCGWKILIALHVFKRKVIGGCVSGGEHWLVWMWWIRLADVMGLGGSWWLWFVRRLTSVHTEALSAGALAVWAAVLLQRMLKPAYQNSACKAGYPVQTTPISSHLVTCREGKKLRTKQH